MSDLTGRNILAPREADQFIQIPRDHPFVEALLDQCFVLALVGVVARPEVDAVDGAKLLIVHVVGILVVQHQVEVVAVEFHLSLGVVPFDCSKVITSCSNLDVELDAVFFGAVLT